ncbi:MAG: hypothetical protein PHT15_00820, partial [Gallionellaceae bacterium]|nr:hypothetical protein [Gallionellaceae bacterium]
KVLERTVLGDGCNALELPSNIWHAVLSLDKGGVIFEVKHGPYLPVGECDVAAWCKGLDAATLNGWYAVACGGDKLPAACCKHNSSHMD